ncbi:MAG: gliding motility-associated C-terminal domain-containing protein [Bacteroidota bacterium]|nr:gliding motility-associated C-terminal domain-containing protein [Bacteroidota bacterium]
MLLHSPFSNPFYLFLLLTCSALLIPEMGHSQEASGNRSAELRPNSLPNRIGDFLNERNILEDRSQWKEIPSKRSEYSSSFLTPDNRIIIQYSKLPLNYYKNNVLVPVDINPASSQTGLSAENQPFPLSVKKNGAVCINEGSSSPILFSSNTKINDVASENKIIEVEGPHAIMRNILPGVDKTFEFRFNSLKYNYVLHQAMGTSDLVIEEGITLPEGAEIIAAQGYGIKDKEGWKGALSVISKAGEVIGSMRGAVCYDAAKNYFLATYITSIIDGEQKVKIIVASSWINDPSRVYPITIDPLVTGPTSTWTGGLIASCLAPANNADSILVTIPAQISVTGFFVSGSYYASPFTTAVMSDGQMYFSTVCGQTTNFTVAPPTGSSAGTGYLTNYDLRSPLLCCFPQSCSAQSFYLRMHIYRTAPGTGCNTTYIYHDPFSGYPFSAYVEGHTVEAYATQWNVIPTSVCSNVCTVTGNVYIRYGVPPFTITHPWMTGSIVAGTPAGCSFSNTIKLLTLTVPACPVFCDTTSSLSVPPPTVTDACGNVIAGMLPEVIVLKPAPDVVSTPNPATVCSEIPFSLSLSSCLSGSSFNWNGNSASGTGSVIDTISNSSSSVNTVNYLVSASLNGCNSDTVTVPVNVDPTPNASFSLSVPVIVNQPALFTDTSVPYGGTVNSWNWDFGDLTFSSFQNPFHTYTIPGIYPVCLAIQTSDGCVDTVCQDVTVIPAELSIPNVITPNGDNINDFLYFRYLEYFGNNNLMVFDRWGKKIFEKENYTNDWNATSFSDGTYYFILSTSDGKSYPGFVQVIHD